jgi:hypothetical protein
MTMMMRRTAAAGALLAGAVLAAAAPARGFECYPYPTQPAARADAAFLGRVVGRLEYSGGRLLPESAAARWPGPVDTAGLGDGMLVVRFAVDSVWHGVRSAEATIYGYGRYAEGLPVQQVGERWLIVASRDRRRRLVASVCAGSTSYRDRTDPGLLSMRRALGLGDPHPAPAPRIP